MSFWNFFKTNHQNDTDQYLQMLMKVAKADGQIDEKEYRFIQELGHKFDKTPGQIDTLLNTDVETIAAPTGQDKLRLVFDLICIMMVDKDIDDNELDICTTMATKSGFEPELVKDIIYRINQEIEQGQTVVQAYEKVYETLKNV
ncbi:MAG: hypothetical protein ACR2MX_01155 [Cyclobacteriaceae bacterium]